MCVKFLLFSLARADDLEEELGKLRRRLSNEEHRRIEAENSAAEHQASAQTCTRRLNDLTHALDQAMGDADLARRAAERTQELELLNKNLTRALSESQKELEGSRATVSSLQQTVGDLELGLQQAEDNADAIRREFQQDDRNNRLKLDQLESDCGRWKQKYNSLEEELSNTCQQRDDANGTVHRLRAELDPLKHELRNLEELLSVMRQTLAERDHQLELKDETLGRLERTIDEGNTAKHELQELRMAWDQQTQSHARLNEQLRRQQEDCKQFQVSLPLLLLLLRHNCGHYFVTIVTNITIFIIISRSCSY